MGVAVQPKANDAAARSSAEFRSSTSSLLKLLVLSSAILFLLCGTVCFAVVSYLTFGYCILQNHCIIPLATMPVLLGFAVVILISGIGASLAWSAGSNRCYPANVVLSIVSPLTFFVLLFVWGLKYGTHHQDSLPLYIGLTLIIAALLYMLVRFVKWTSKESKTGKDRRRSEGMR